MPLTTKERQLLLRRAKDSERRLGRWLLEHDGPDSQFKPGGGLVTTTGRIGHINELGFDTLSRSYAGENKHTMLSKKQLAWWAQVTDRAAKFSKEPLLRIDPSNDGRQKAIHIITEERHAQLLDAERELLCLKGSTNS